MSDNGALILAASLVIFGIAGCEVITLHDSEAGKTAQYEALAKSGFTAHEIACLLSPPPFGDRCADVEQRKKP